MTVFSHILSIAYIEKLRMDFWLGQLLDAEEFEGTLFPKADVK